MGLGLSCGKESDKMGKTHVVEIAERIDVENVDVHGREEHVWDEACEHVPWVERQEAGR